MMDGESYMKPFGKHLMLSFLIVWLFLFNVEGKAQEGGVTDRSTSDILEEWDKFILESVTVPDKKLSSIVIYRPLESKGRAVNVYIDGEYHASLLPGAYTQAMVCPGNHKIVTAYTNPATRYREKKKQGKTVALKSALISFYRVTNPSSHGVTLLPMSKKEVTSIFTDKPRRQYHTISRVSRKSCLQTKDKKSSVDLKKENADDSKSTYPQLGTHQIEVK